MTRVLILGAAGMLGHKVFQRASAAHEVVGTIRGWDPRWDRLGVLDRRRLVTLDATDFDAVERVVADARPDWIVNCIGIVKQRDEAANAALSRRINGELPLFLAGLGARLVHISTDCVFSGARGGYREDDRPDPVDAYGETKLQGEAAASQALVLRTSLIGREITRGVSLVEWLLRRAGPRANGYTRAIFSGLTTIAAADVITGVIASGLPGSGLYHLSADPIDKHRLLLLIRDAYQRSIAIAPDDSFVIDRSLDSSRFRAATGYVPSPWPAMIAAMASDPTPYDRLDLPAD